jgi:hypothetical protein
MINWPQCALSIGYKETLVEETVNMKFFWFSNWWPSQVEESYPSNDF